MVIQHNLQSINSNRQSSLVNTNRAKSAEKLSSGYKINRAADDAAGLSISEKMRRQMRGLHRASANGGDGISLVQIADGALNEVHDMLQRGNELAVQAANGTNSYSDRQAINNEIVQLKKEIDSITARTKFNETMIFSKNGILPRLDKIRPDTKTQNAMEELAAKITDEYFPNAVDQILTKFSSLGDKLKELAADDKSKYNTRLSIQYIDGVGKTLAYMSAAFLNSDQSFYSGSLLMAVDKDDFPSINLSDSQMEKLESTIAHEVMHGIMDTVLSKRMSREGGAEDFPKWFVEGTAQLAGGGYTTGWNYELSNIASGLSSADDSSKDNLIHDYLSRGGEYTVDTREYGHGYLAAAYASYLAADGNDVTQSNLLNGANKMFQKLMDSDDSFQDVMADVMGISEAQLKNAIDSGSTTSPKEGKMSAVEFVRRLTYESLGGAGSLVTSALNTGGSSILGESADKDAQPVVIVSKKVNYTALKDDEVDNRGHYERLALHLGTDADMTNKVEVNLYDMSSGALRLTDTNVLTSENATDAINDFGDAIMMVSAVRSYFGAVQNRIEHTIKNLDNVVENTTASESRIRDTNIADEMVKLSAANILSQAGQSMLAQANQSTQGVMSLLQG
jgi:flagellin